MKSRTSFFNLTAFRKNITRFWPVWGLYTVFLLLILFGIQEQEPGYMARDVLMITRAAGIGNLLYAGVVTMCLFGDLFKSRLCNALHAFPVRREGWLLTDIATGFLFSIIPNLLVCALTSLQLGEYAYCIWNLFAVATLQYVFFFGTAVLSALCAGNQLGMLAIYSIIHFVVVLIYFLAEVIYQPLIYGIEMQTDKFYRFFPLSRMYSEYVETRFNYGEPIFEGYATETWTHLYICAAVGAVAFVLAWLVYRRRHLERAGDFIALRPLAPVFLSVYTIAVGTLLYSFFSMINQASYVIYAIGIVIGFFTGQMLLNRTVKVFYKRSWLGFAVLAVALSGSMALTWLDPMGIGSYVPPIDKVESAVIYGADKSYIYYDPEEYVEFAVTEPEEIAKVQELHMKMAAIRPGETNNYDVRVHYKLKNGQKIDRYYSLNVTNPLTEEAKKWFSDARYIFQVDDPEILYSLFGYFSVESHKADDLDGQKFFFNSDDPELLKGLLDAFLADCQAGTMCQTWILHDGEVTNDYSVSFELNPEFEKEFEGDYRYKYLSIYSDCKNTIAYLEQLFAELPENYNEQSG